MFFQLLYLFIEILNIAEFRVIWTTSKTMVSRELLCLKWCTIQHILIQVIFINLGKHISKKLVKEKF
jgi:hypothetical protein